LLPHQPLIECSLAGLHLISVVQPDPTHSNPLQPIPTNRFPTPVPHASYWTDQDQRPSRVTSSLKLPPTFEECWAPPPKPPQDSFRPHKTEHPHILNELWAYTNPRKRQAILSFRRSVDFLLADSLDAVHCEPADAGTNTTESDGLKTQSHGAGGFFFRRKADTRRAGIALDRCFLVTCGVNQAPRTPSFLASYQQRHDSNNSRERGAAENIMDLWSGGNGNKRRWRCWERSNRTDPLILASVAQRNILMHCRMTAARGRPCDLARSAPCEIFQSGNLLIGEFPNRERGEI
jgi:hypothetical protein